jgi:fumarate reductase flavoprotein subunit
MSRAKEGPDSAGRLSRRSFLQGVLAAGSIAALGPVAGCAPKASAAETTTRAGTHTWEKKPAPIPDSMIAKTITADILVIGAGMSGMAAALTASEEGAKVVLLEKSGKPSYRGIDYGSVNCDIQKSVGIKLDPNEVLMEALRWGGHRGDYRVIKAWVDHSAEAMNWMAGKLRAGGATVVPQPTDFQVIPGASYKYFPTDSFLCVPTPPVMKVAEEQGYNPYAASWAYALRPQLDKFGVQTLWNTRAHQLVRQEGGPVTGAIAQDADGKYVKILAEKGVVLCTGDYGRNDEMLRAFIPYVDDIYDVNSPANSTGDGHIMGMWAGAAIDEGPHAPMYFDEGTVGAPHAESIPVLRQPWLYLNMHGERYTNEDLPYAYVVNATNAQPDHVKWVLFDAKWPEDGPKMHMIVCKDFRCGLHDPKFVAELVAKGVILSANSIEELVAKTDMPKEQALASITHYNELCAKGADGDFGKRPNCLSSLTKAPFYAAKTGTTLLVTLGGLKINDTMQVLDTSASVIPRLYAAGNTSGCFFANEYPITLSGVSHGRALTFGRRAVLHALGKLPTTNA